MILYILRENAIAIFVFGVIITMLLFGLLDSLKHKAENELKIKYNKKQHENVEQAIKEQTEISVPDFTENLLSYYLAEAIISLFGAIIIFGIPIMFCLTKSTTFYRNEYDIDKMLTEYKTVEITKENMIENDYLVHCEGFGRDEWIHVVKVPSEYDKFKK